MTRKAWTTEPQRGWLEARLAQFREAQHTKTTTTIFFPQTQMGFKNQWPLEPPTNEELAKASGSIEKATADKNKALNIVSNQLTYLSTRPAAQSGVPFLFSVSKIGLITTSVLQHREMVLAGF
jgi:hypothetical protein